MYDDLKLLEIRSRNKNQLYFVIIVTPQMIYVITTISVIIVVL